MEIAFIFLKTFLAGTCLVFLWILLNKISASILPLWNNKKSLSLLGDLINNDIYDKVTVIRSLKYYIPPKFQESPVDKKQTLQGNRLANKKDLTRRIDMFINNDTTCRHLLILADPGMGKTCFALNYYVRNLKRPKKERNSIVLVPLGLKKADDLILAPSDKEGRVLFLDGLDEDISDSKTLQNRLRQLIDIGQKYKRIIITCDTNSFPIDKNMAVKTGYERIGPENINENYYYELRKLYLSAFGDNDIRNYIHSHFSIWEPGFKRKIHSLIKNISFAQITPLLLSHSQEALRQETNIQSISDFYEKIIQNWITHEPNWQDKSLLNQFAQLFAVEIYLGRKKRGLECISQNDLVKKTMEWGITPYSFENNVRSLINQTQTGLFKFAHRSIMEYCFVKRLVSGDKSCYQIPLTNQMGIFLLEILENKNPENLKMEFNWLSRFELMAQGLTMEPSSDNKLLETNLFKAILRKNHQYDFLTDLNVLMQNPIFYEFGWDPNLNENLNKAVYQSKPSLMKLSKKNWVVTINQTQIEITKPHQKKKTILINEKDLTEYSRLSDKSLIKKLGAAIGLDGLILLNNINRSKIFCVFPDLKSFQKFTLYFWLK